MNTTRFEKHDPLDRGAQVAASHARRVVVQDPVLAASILSNCAHSLPIHRGHSCVAWLRGLSRVWFGSQPALVPQVFRRIAH